MARRHLFLSLLVAGSLLMAGCGVLSAPPPAEPSPIFIGTGGTERKPVDPGACGAPIFAPDDPDIILSDLFYDSVDYISFINHTIFDQVGPSGLPYDYVDFLADVDGTGLTLTILLDPDRSSTPIRVPADLSPYGRIYTMDHTTTGTGQTIPVITTTSTPSAGDDRINEQIRTAAAAHPENRCFLLDVGQEHVSLVGFRNPGCETPEGATGMAQLVGQWFFSTWDEAEMTVADLPADWHTIGMVGPTAAGALVCPLDRNDDSSCAAAPLDGTLSPKAEVRSVWANPYGQVNAIITDGDLQYALGYGRV